MLYSTTNSPRGTWMTKVLGGIVGWFIAFIVVSAIAAIVDTTLAIRSQPAQIACAVKRMVPMRHPFSTQVTCVPAMTRNDTLTINH